LEDDRAIFELATQPRDRSGQNAAMVEAHRLAELGEGAARQRGLATIASRLLDQPGLVEQLVTGEHLLLVPGPPMLGTAAVGEADPHPLAPPGRAGSLRLAGAPGPVVELRQNHLVENLGPLPPPVLPGEKAIPRLEPGARGAQRGCALRHAGER